MAAERAAALHSTNDVLRGFARLPHETYGGSILEQVFSRRNVSVASVSDAVKRLGGPGWQSSSSRNGEVCSSHQYFIAV